MEAYQKASCADKKIILLQWAKAGGTKANLPCLAKQCLTIKRKDQAGGNYGLMTPGRISELSRITDKMYPTLDAWEAALRKTIERNQACFSKDWPAGTVGEVLVEGDFWQSEFFYIHKADNSWMLEQSQVEKYSKEGELNNKTSEAFGAMQEMPFQQQTSAQDSQVDDQPIINMADLGRGKQISSRLKKLGESIGKAIGQTLNMGAAGADADTVVKRVQKEFMKLRQNQVEAYNKDDHKSLMTSIDGLFDQLALAFPTLGGLQKAPSKRRLDSAEDADGKKARVEAVAPMIEGVAPTAALGE